MCNFFSFITDGNKKIYYFNKRQREGHLRFNDGTPITHCDSHTSIACYYGLNEDDWSKGEYNPYTNVLVLDQQNTTWDENAVRQMLTEVNWNDMCGDIEGVKAFLQDLKQVKLMRPDGTFKENERVRLFKTRQEAEAAFIGESSENFNNYWRAACNAVSEADPCKWYGIYYGIFNAVYDATFLRPKFYVSDIALYLAITYVYGGSLFRPELVDYVNRRMDVWRHGYGVAFDVNGVLYCCEQMD